MKHVIKVEHIIKVEHVIKVEHTIEVEHVRLYCNYNLSVAAFSAGLGGI